MPRKTIVGIMGPDSSEKITELAEQMGKLVAEQGWIVLTGGRSRGVMDAASKGAKSAGGLTIGILPSADGLDASDAVDIPIITGMGSARDNINVLSSDVVVAIGMGPGTSAEVSLALKANKHVVLLGAPEEADKFFAMLKPDLVHVAKDVDGALTLIKSVVAA